MVLLAENALVLPVNKQQIWAVVIAEQRGLSWYDDARREYSYYLPIQFLCVAMDSSKNDDRDCHSDASLLLV